jgi:uncharacterized protein YkwD
MVHRVLRLGVLALALAAFATAAGPAGAGRSLSMVAANRIEAPTIAAINELRRRHGLRPLRLSTQLAASAAAQSEAMGEGGFFSHASPGGRDFSARIGSFYKRSGYASWSVGENLLWAGAAVRPETVLEMWLRSPSHRRNLLDPRWTEIGLGAVEVPQAPGVYGGADVTIVSADFGTRS